MKSHLNKSLSQHIFYCFKIAFKIFLNNSAKCPVQGIWELLRAFKIFFRVLKLVQMHLKPPKSKYTHKYFSLYVCYINVRFSKLHPRRAPLNSIHFIISMRLFLASFHSPHTITNTIFYIHVHMCDI